jgi:hypothetical protein
MSDIDFLDPKTGAIKRILTSTCKFLDITLPITGMHVVLFPRTGGMVDLVISGPDLLYDYRIPVGTWKDAPPNPNEVWVRINEGHLARSILSVIDPSRALSEYWTHSNWEELEQRKVARYGSSAS